MKAQFEIDTTDFNTRYTNEHSNRGGRALATSDTITHAQRTQADYILINSALEDATIQPLTQSVTIRA